MSKTKKIWFSIAIGWGIKLIPLAIINFVDNDVTKWIAAIANIDAVIGGLLGERFGGIGIMGYREDGQPIYEGTPILPLFLFVGFFSGLIIYPLIIYGILTLWNRFRTKNEYLKVDAKLFRTNNL